MTLDPASESMRPIDARGAQGLQIGDNNTQYNIILWRATRATARRAISPLPYGLTVVLGRDGILDDLSGRLKAARTAVDRVRPVCALVHGIPGVGKSALVAEYARRHVAEYGVVWWVPMHDPTAAATAFTQLASQLDMLGPEDHSDPVAAVHALLAARTDRWLLIFDDIAEPGALSELLPASANGDVLMTSRNPGFGAPDIMVRVSELATPDAVDILLRRANATDRVSAERLAAELGGLPLAVEQAAMFVASSMGAISLADYLRLLRQRRGDVLDEGLALEYVPRRRSVEAAFRLALDQLTVEAGGLLNLISCFSPERIPMALLSFLSEPGIPQYRVCLLSGAGLSDPLVRSRAIADLVGYSLIQPWQENDETDGRDGRGTIAEYASVSLHRLTRDAALGRLNTADIGDWRSLARALIDRMLPDNPQDPAAWPEYDLLISHVRATTDISAVAADDTYWRAATFLERRGDSRTARLFWEDIEEAARAVHGADDPRTLAAAGNLAVSQAGSGSLREAAELEERVLDSRRRTLGDSHPDTLTAMGNLAIRLAALGHLSAAACLERDVLDKRQRILGKHHPDTLTALGNLSIRLAALGDLAGAIALGRQALSDLQSQGNRTAILRAMANLAGTLAISGDLTTAVSLERQVLAQQRSIFGDQHPHTLQGITNLASHLTLLGASTEAVSIMSPAIDALMRIRGAEHPDTLAAMTTLAAALSATGDITAAIDLQRRVFEARRRILGDAHPDTYRSMGNLAISLGRLGAVTEAIRLEREVAAGFERLLGADHIDTYTAKDNLATSLASRGETAEALSLERQVYDGYQRIFGHKHPQTRRSCANIAKWATRSSGPG
jgi:tetratricopeptide (TPR) repeat protein